MVSWPALKPVKAWNCTATCMSLGLCSWLKARRKEGGSIYFLAMGAWNLARPVISLDTGAGDPWIIGGSVVVRKLM